MLNEKSLLSREQSAVIKGLLIVMIILGHNNLLMTNPVSEEERSVFNWLYSFHVQGFFILSFLYGKKPVSSRRVADNLFRLWVPYFWVFILCLIANVFFTGSINSFYDYLLSFIIGNKPFIKEVVGFYFPWFLPAMFAVLLFKGVADRCPKFGIGLFSISMILWLFDICGIFPRFEFQSYIPFALLQGVMFFGIAVCGKRLCEYVDHRRNAAWIVIFMFLVFSLCFFCRDFFPVASPMLWHFLLSPLAFALIFSFRRGFEKSRVLRFMGDYSMPIYAFHVFVYNLLEIALRHFGLIGQHVIVWGVVLLAATIGITVALVLLLEKMQWVYRILFPKGCPFIK